ncbi:hypothetical protein AURDEDRAFT_173149 [Auricularia subglabra TFB-10046 SS5]|nr:hypothetical protein AURDEDRAFT_173149 [Auricularia subglabra TFB-10046 SS5]
MSTRNFNFNLVVLLLWELLERAGQIVFSWDEQFLWTYIDSRGARIFNHRFHTSEPFFAWGNFPSTVFNGTHEVRLENPWAGSPSPGVAPFSPRHASRAVTTPLTSSSVPS